MHGESCEEGLKLLRLWCEPWQWLTWALNGSVLRFASSVNRVLNRLVGRMWPTYIYIYFLFTVKKNKQKTKKLKFVLHTAGGGAGSLTCPVWPLNNVQGNVLAFQMFIQLTCAMWVEWTTIQSTTIYDSANACQTLSWFLLLSSWVKMPNLCFIWVLKQHVLLLRMFLRSPRWMAETFAVPNIEVAGSLAPSLAGVVAPSERSCDTPLSGTAGWQQLPGMC